MTNFSLAVQRVVHIPQVVMLFITELVQEQTLH